MDLTLDAVRKQFSKYPNPQRPDRTIIQLLNIILSKNDFEFNNKFYLQTCGTAMGLSSAPHLANIFLIDFDEKARNFLNHPEFYYRYLDDIFFIFDGTVEDLKLFENYLNSLIPGIKLTFSYSTTACDFLDMTIFKSQIQNDCTTLNTKIYFKKTDTHQLLHKDSFHPPHTFSSIIKSQIIRYKRLSSLEADFEKTCKILFSFIKNLGYSYNFLRKIKRKVKFSKKELKPKKNNKLQVLPIVIQYSECTSNLTKKYKNTLKTSSLNDYVYPIIAFASHQNLAKILTKSKFTNNIPS
jgi:hypothetical protein